MEMKKVSLQVLIILMFLVSGICTVENLSAKNNQAGEKQNKYNLFSDMKTSYRIALGRDASESEQWAARELQHWLMQISGAYFPVQFMDQPHTGPQIILGYNDSVRKVPGVSAPAYNDESYRYFNSGSDIIIYGGKQRGTMFGVMSFLENEFGCRWYTPSVTIAPKRNSITFSSFNHSESPGIEVRNDFYYEAFDPVWAARNKMNGRMWYKEQPGGVESYWNGHTFFVLVPPSEFYKDHPEYYSLIDGKRIYEYIPEGKTKPQETQLCLSNPDVLKITIENLKKHMRESPEYKIYCVSQNDGVGSRETCKCDKCQKIVKEEGSESGIVIWFVNQVAKAVEKEFPDKLIGTFAYQFSITPPKNIRPGKNVAVRFCPYGACSSHDFKSCPENKKFFEDLKGWSKITRHLFIWDYVVNFHYYIQPFPNFDVLQSNIKTFQEYNAEGIMEQAVFEGRGGEFSELKCYLISRLLWNPDCNTEDVINDFMYGYYGRAGKYIRQYFDFLKSKLTPEIHIRNRMRPDDPFFSDELIQTSDQIFKNAEKVADNDEILSRVEMTSLPVLYLKCKRMPVQSRNDGTYEKFISIAKRENITNWGIKENFESLHKYMEEAK